MSVTQKLVSFAASTDFEDLPESVVETTKLTILNNAGGMLAGTRTRIGQLHVELAQQLGGGRPEASIAGCADRVSVPAAAYANGNLAFALDYEDSIHYIIHPGFITTCAGLALAEDREQAGRNLIESVALGVEIASRIADSMQPTPERGREVWGEQYHPFAAAATAGKLLGLDAETLDVAFGVTGTYSTVPSVYKYFGPVEETRPMREVKMGWGWMTMAGVMGALSAEKGFRGGHGILDGERGFHKMAGSDRCDFEAMTRGLGSDWNLLDIEFKIHPSIAVNHPAFEATRQLMDEHDIRAGDVEWITLVGPWMESIGDTDPRGPVDAQFSLPYTVAATLLEYPLGPGMYQPEQRESDEVRRLLNNTSVESDERADEAFFNEQRMIFTVQFDLSSDETVRKEIEFPRDKPDFGREKVLRKYHDQAELVLSSGEADRLRDTILNLEERNSVEEITTLLRG